MRNFIFFLLASLFVLACKKNSQTDQAGPVNPPPPVNTDSSVNKNVHVIDSSKLILTYDSNLIKQGQYEFTYSGSSADFEINDIIIGATNGGYIRKITGMATQGNKVTFETTQGTLEDVFKNKGFAFNMNSDSLSKTQNGYQLDLSNIVLYQDGPLNLTLTSGSISFDANWNFGFNFKGSTLDTFAMSCKNASLSGQFNLNISAAQSTVVADHTSSLKAISKTTTYWVPVVILGVPAEIPIVVKMDLNFVCRFSLQASASVSRDIFINTNNNVDLGIAYKNAHWNTIYNPNSSFSITTGDKSGSANVTANLSLIPVVTITIDGIVGPYASAGIKELVIGHVNSPNLDWDFYAGVWLNAVLGAKAQIFGKSVFDFSKEWNSDTLSFQTPWRIDKVSGDNQSGNGGETLPAPIVVRVVDNNGSPQSNVPVYFTASGGGGSVSPTSMLTDANGRAQTQWTVGGSGPQELAAKSVKADGSLIGNAPVVFTANAEKKSLKIGDETDGGTVFYLDNTGEHGLVCADVDQGIAPWDLTPFDPSNYQAYAPALVGSSGTSVGTGSSNTATILSTLGGGSYAASLCSNYNGGGFNDWSLPSIDELALMYQNLAAAGLGNFVNTYYWSSSEIDYRAVWSFKFDTGAPFDGAWKNNAMNVRAVRAF
ncbi:MAG TPA: Ig-like domain-containing protein [Chitinophagaceae bacterium]|jgi:uncharacterized protein DUF1566/Big-like domain-containing protein|nr:Ig-like domain-containing protein [Chitinophagaceae bacterium]